MRTSRTLVLLAAVTALATRCHLSTRGSPAGSPSGSPSGSRSEGTSGSAAPTGPASEGLATCRKSSLRITPDTSLARGGRHGPADRGRGAAQSAVRLSRGTAGLRRSRARLAAGGAGGELPGLVLLPRHCPWAAGIPTGRDAGGPH